jgi:hypothetical protein
VIIAIACPALRPVFVTDFFTRLIIPPSVISTPSLSVMQSLVDAVV